jgi:hypothetical protein
MHSYEGSDGRRYTDGTVWEKLETGEWRVFCWNEDTRLQVVETEDQEFLFLRPVEEGASMIGTPSEERA